MLWKNRGLTLLELLVVVAFISLLIAIVYPAYRTYLLKSQRSDGVSAILDLKAAEEKYRTTNATYGTLAQINKSADSQEGYYTLLIDNISETGYAIKANATTKGNQNRDTGCTQIVLTKAGATETRTPAVCWQ